MKSIQVRKMTDAGVLLALALLMPVLSGRLPEIGKRMSLMHIPVLLCGLLVGPVEGLIVGITTPVLSHLIFGMPPAPVLPSMLCELTVYGLMTGLLNKVVKIENGLVKNYVVLIGAMLCGRITYGILNALIFKAGSYSMAAWTSAAFVTALPGIIIQLVLIPILVDRLKKANLF